MANAEKRPKRRLARKIKWYRVISGNFRSCWEPHGAPVRTLVDQEIRHVFIQDLKQGDIVLSHDEGWREGQIEYLQPITRIEVTEAINPPKK